MATKQFSKKHDEHHDRAHPHPPHQFHYGHREPTSYATPIMWLIAGGLCAGLALYILNRPAPPPPAKPAYSAPPPVASQAVPLPTTHPDSKPEPAAKATPEAPANKTSEKPVKSASAVGEGEKRPPLPLPFWAVQDDELSKKANSAKTAAPPPAAAPNAEAPKATETPKKPGE